MSDFDTGWWMSIQVDVERIDDFEDLFPPSRFYQSELGNNFLEL
jgi:hypothetical protein